MEMRNLALAVCLAFAMAPVVASAQAARTAPAPAKVYSTSKTTIGKLMADPAAKAVLIQHIPMMAGNSGEETPGGNIQDQAAEMTLKELADATRAYTGEMFSDKVLAAIDADLAKLTPLP
jgi:para-nitrobenzyl esterase